MAYSLIEKIANSKNYGKQRNVNNIKYIVIHYTGNNGDTAKNNATYFANNVTYTSAHYFVDNEYVYRSVKENYSSYSVGKNYGSDNLFGIVTNSNSISIELCCQTKKTSIYPDDSTIDNAVALTKSLMAKYNIPQSKVVRHYDVCSKKCPKYWMDDDQWKQAFWYRLGNTYSGELPTATVKKGSKGKNVTLLQIFLNWYFDVSIVVDGIFGSKTYNLVTLFQKENGLTADGIFGPKSIAKAKEVCR